MLSKTFDVKYFMQPEVLTKILNYKYSGELSAMLKMGTIFDFN